MSLAARDPARRLFGWLRREAQVVGVAGVLLPVCGSVVWAQQAPLAKPPSVATGEALLQERRYREAMDAFEAALAASPANAAAREGEVAAATAWALEGVRQGHPEQAMEVLERGIGVLPTEPELLRSFGIEATTLKQFPIAEQALRAADAARPHDAKTVYALARLETEEQHLPEAERDLQAYLALRPDDASAYFGLGHIYAMRQQTTEARAAFAHSLTLQPSQTESYYQLGQLDLEAHQDEAAQKEFAQVLARAPQHAGALTGMGQLALRAKDYAGAEQLLAAAEKSDPAYQTPHYFRGLALAKLGRKDEAAEELRRGDSRPHAVVPGAAGEGETGAGPKGEIKP